MARALAKGPIATFVTTGPIAPNSLCYNKNGGSGIRTHEGFRPPVFKTGALNRSATPPSPSNVRDSLPLYTRHIALQTGGVLQSDPNDSFSSLLTLVLSSPKILPIRSKCGHVGIIGMERRVLHRHLDVRKAKPWTHQVDCDCSVTPIREACPNVGARAPATGEGLHRVFIDSI